MNQWTCTLEAVNAAYTGDVQDLSERLAAGLGRRDVAVSPGDGRIVACFTIEARLVLQATETAQRAWNKALDDDLAWSIVSLSARRADQPDDLPGLPEVLGVAEVAQRLDVSTQRVVELARTHPSFPAPLAELASGAVWTAWQVGAFQRSEIRQPGPPRSGNEAASS